MGNTNVAIVAFCIAVAFILVVAFLPTSKMEVTASMPTGTPVVDTKAK